MTTGTSSSHGDGLSGGKSRLASLRRAAATAGDNAAASMVTAVLVALTGVMAEMGVVLAGRLITESATRLEALPGDGEVTLSWTVSGAGAAGIHGWEYRRRAYSSAWGDWQKIPGGAEARKHVVADLTNSWKYTFRVRAVGNGKGPGAASNRSTATPSGVERRLTEIRDLLAGQESVRDFCRDDPMDAGGVRFGGGSFGTGAEPQQRALEKIADAMRREAEGRTLVIVEGHASADHDAAYNLDLSEDRAEAVIGELKKAKRGLRNDRLEYRAVARGERHERGYPDRENHHNRRVQVWVCTPKGRPAAGA